VVMPTGDRDHIGCFTDQVKLTHALVRDLDEAIKVRYLPCIIILFLHLLSTNHKYTQSCYFPLLYKPAAQKVKMVWNSSTRSSRLCAAPVTILEELWSLPLFRFTRESISL
jgi:hypothetical protein